MGFNELLYFRIRHNAVCQFLFDEGALSFEMSRRHGDHLEDAKVPRHPVCLKTYEADKPQQ